MKINLGSSSSNQYLSDLENQELIRLNTSLPNLEKWFASIPLCEALDEEKAWLQPISNFQQVIGRKQKQVAFFGVFKAGKSTLLNAIIGREMLPSRNNRATGVVTKIGYAPWLSTQVIIRTVDGDFLEQTIPYEDLAKYILLDLSSGVTKIPEGIEEVLLFIPHPLLRNQFTLVDTPGLMDNSILTERSFQELAKSDLAVMVLSADKLLSETEKESAQRVHELLNGNLVFIVNRLGFIEEEEQAEVLEWAKTSLQGLDNPLVGQPCIFYTDAKAALEAKTNGAKNSASLNSLLLFEQWLEGVFNTSIGDKIAILSRLTILEHHLSNSQFYFQAWLNQAKTTVKEIAQAEAEAWAEKQAKLKKDINEERLRLSRVRTQLYELGNNFISQSRANAYSLMEKDVEWQGKLSQCFYSALNSYTARVDQEVTSSALQTQIKIPGFYISKLDIDTNVTVIQDKSVAIGSGVGAAVGTLIEPGGGTAIGAALGAWLGKKFLGVDVKTETLNFIEQKAKEIIPTITSQAEQHLDKIDQLLIALENSSDQTPPPSNALEVAKKNEQDYTNVVSWCEEFQSTINEIKEVVK